MNVTQMKNMIALLKCIQNECEKILSNNQDSEEDWIEYICRATYDMIDVISDLSYAVSDWEEMNSAEQ